MIHKIVANIQLKQYHGSYVTVMYDILCCEIDCLQ